jgi:hypothetical protein
MMANHPPLVAPAEAGAATGSCRNLVVHLVAAPASAGATQVGSGL